MFMQIAGDGNFKSDAQRNSDAPTDVHVVSNSVSDVHIPASVAGLTTSISSISVPTCQPPTLHSSLRTVILRLPSSIHAHLPTSRPVSPRTIIVRLPPGKRLSTGIPARLSPRKPVCLPTSVSARFPPGIPGLLSSGIPGRLSTSVPAHPPLSVTVPCSSRAVHVSTCPPSNDGGSEVCRQYYMGVIVSNKYLQCN